MHLLFFIPLLFSQSSDMNISNFPTSDTEPYLAVNPSNGNNLIAAWMRVTSFTQLSICTKASFDGGITWGNQNILPHMSSNFTSADVSITFNNSGTAFLSYVDYKLVLDSGFVRIVNSANGGVSWSSPVNAVSAADSPDLPVDRPWIAADYTSGTYSGRLYLVSKSYFAATPPHKIWLSISSDSGSTWTPIKQLDDSIPVGLTNIMGTPAVGADGSLYVAYPSYVPSLSPFARTICIKSTDGGNSFIPYPTQNYPANAAITDTLYQGSYSLSANPANASNIVLQFTDQRNGDPDIESQFSVDGGITWSAVQRVNDDAMGNGVGQDMSWSAFSSSGIFAIAWRDRRNFGTSSQDSFEVFTAVSTDGGISFFPNYQFSSAPSPFINIQRGNDFIGVGLNSNTLFSDWCDRRTPNNEIFFRGESLSLIASSENNLSSSHIFARVYPNPSGSEIEIYDLNNRKYDLAVFDVSGRNIYTSQIAQCSSYKVPYKFSSGNYFFKLKFLSEEKTIKVVVK